MRRPRLVLVTDPAFGEDAILLCVERAGAALPPGELCVQLRDKTRLRAQLRPFAERIRVVTRAHGALLVINGDAILASEIGADGVHLGGGAGAIADARALFPAAWVSVAAHSDEDVVRAVDQGADGALVSPIFASQPLSPLASAKHGRGLGAIRSACAVSAGRIALYALGGVTPDRVRSCVAAGADGVAVVRALLAAGDPAEAARALLLAARRW